MFSAEAAKPAEEVPKAEEKKEQPVAAAPEFTPEEYKKGQEEWGIKYDDECLKFEKEW
jgi:hypothetical protein